MTADVIDGELADQLGGLIDAVETVRWVDVPGVSSTTAATFNRMLIDARAEVLAQPRLIADGGVRHVETRGPTVFRMQEPTERSRATGATWAIGPDQEAGTVDVTLETDAGHVTTQLTAGQTMALAASLMRATEEVDWS